MHLYIHTPFCRRRCSYCDFAIAVRRRVPSEDFVDTVLVERALRAAGEGWDTSPWETVYLGGGTPSLLGVAAISRLLDVFPRVPDAEVTLEANPEDVTDAAASGWRHAGVNRVSVGLQSFQPEVLAWMHRGHDADRARQAVGALRDAGVSSVSLDLIFALPDHLGHDPARDVDQALALEPDHLSAYGLTLEPQTPYARWAGRGRAVAAGDDRFASEFLLVHERLTAAGYEHYEVSNFARVGGVGSHRARHNGAYWAARPYVGLGPSAHGFDGSRRRWNRREWVDYRDAVARREDPVAGREDLSPSQRWLETVYLELRTADGVSSDTRASLRAEAVLAATAAGWLTERDGRLRPTPHGWLVMDQLTTALTTSPGGG